MSYGVQARDPERVWFSSDHHFGHKAIVRHTDRPFDSIDEMDEALLEDWRATVGPDDWVIYLGDLIWDNPARIVPHLTGKILYIYGNHDARLRKWAKKLHPFVWEGDLLDVKFPNLRFFGEMIRMVGSHYPILSWNRKHYGQLHVYGHCHGGLSPHLQALIPGSLDVGMDAHGLRMLNLVQVLEKIGEFAWNKGSLT